MKSCIDLLDVKNEQLKTLEHEKTLLKDERKRINQERKRLKEDIDKLTQEIESLKKVWKVKRNPKGFFQNQKFKKTGYGIYLFCISVALDSVLRSIAGVPLVIGNMIQFAIASSVISTGLYCIVAKTTRNKINKVNLEEIQTKIKSKLEEKDRKEKEYAKACNNNIENWYALVIKEKKITKKKSEIDFIIQRRNNAINPLLDILLKREE